MSREHISQMAQAVKGYYSAAKQTAVQIEKNNARYRADIAEGENEKARQQLQRARWEAEDAIHQAQEAGRADAKKAGVYDRFAVSALDLISRVDQVDTFGGGIDSPMLQTSIESFGEPSAFTQALFDLL